MTIRQHVVELFSSKVWKETGACSSKKAARGPKLTALTLCLEGYLPLKNHEHSMSRTGDIKNWGSAAVP